MDSVFEKVSPQSKIEETLDTLVKKSEIPLRAKVLEGFGSIDISNTLFTIEGHSGNSNQIACIRYLRSLLHKGII